MKWCMKQNLFNTLVLVRPQTLNEWWLLLRIQFPLEETFLVNFFFQNLFVWQIFCQICLSWKTRTSLSHTKFPVTFFMYSSDLDFRIVWLLLHLFISSLSSVWWTENYSNTAVSMETTRDMWPFWPESFKWHNFHADRSLFPHLDLLGKLLD